MHCQKPHPKGAREASPARAPNPPSRHSVVRLLGVAALDDPAQWRRDPRIDLVDRLGLFVDDRGERVDDALALKGPPARRHLVEHGSERELVRPVVDVLAFGLFRRHVADCPDDHALARAVVRQRGADRAFRRHGRVVLRQPEIRDPWAPVRRNQDVVRLEITVNDPAGVRGRQASAIGIARSSSLLTGSGPRSNSALSVPPGTSSETM